MNKCKNVHTPIFYERKSPKEHESEQLNPDKNGKIIDTGHKVIRTNLYSLQNFDNYKGKNGLQ